MKQNTKHASEKPNYWKALLKSLALLLLVLIFATAVVFFLWVMAV